MTEPKEWKNRIVGYGTLPAKEYLVNPHNYKIHTALQDRAVEGSLDTLGWVDNVIVNVRTGRLIDGHERVALAMRRGPETPVPFMNVDLTEDEEFQALATLDPIIGLAQTDGGKLDELLRSINSDDERINELITVIAGREVHEHEQVSGLGNLEDEYGNIEDKDLWPMIRLKVPPDTFDKYDAIMAVMPGRDDAEKFDALLSKIEFSEE